MLTYLNYRAFYKVSEWYSKGHHYLTDYDSSPVFFFHPDCGDSSRILACLGRWDLLDLVPTILMSQPVIWMKRMKNCSSRSHDTHTHTRKQLNGSKCYLDKVKEHISSFHCFIALTFFYLITRIPAYVTNSII